MGCYLLIISIQVALLAGCISCTIRPEIEPIPEDHMLINHASRAMVTHKNLAWRNISLALGEVTLT